MKSYKPTTDWEQRAYSQADFNIYPEEVRDSLEAYQETTVAWAGIVQEYVIFETPDKLGIELLLEHHYYNWEVNQEDGRLFYYLSARGEGQFATRWYFNKETDADKIEEMFSTGVLVIVYGVPDTITDDVVFLDAKYVRPIPAENYDADFYDYTPEGNQKF